MEESNFGLAPIRQEGETNFFIGGQEYHKSQWVTDDKSGYAWDLFLSLSDKLIAERKKRREWKRRYKSLRSRISKELGR